MSTDPVDRFRQYHPRPLEILETRKEIQEFSLEAATTIDTAVHIAYRPRLFLVVYAVYPLV